MNWGCDETMKIYGTRLDGFSFNESLCSRFLYIDHCIS